MWKGKNDHCDVLLLGWPHYSFVPLHNLSADAIHLFSSSSPASVKYSTMAMQSTRCCNTMFWWKIFSSVSSNICSVCSLRSWRPMWGVSGTSNRAGITKSPGYWQFLLAYHCASMYLVFGKEFLRLCDQLGEGCLWYISALPPHPPLPQCTVCA